MAGAPPYIDLDHSAIRRENRALFEGIFESRVIHSQRGQSFGFSLKCGLAENALAQGALHSLLISRNDQFHLLALVDRHAGTF